MTSSKTILFFGTDEFSALSLRELIAKGFTIGAVITKPDARKGRGQRVIEPIVKTIAKEHGIAVWQPTSTEELIDHVRGVKDPVGVLVSYGRIIPQSVIDLFTPGIINVHPSLLPLYRGPSPVETAILNGDTVTLYVFLVRNVNLIAMNVMALSNKDLGPNNVDVGDFLCYRVFNLNPGIHFDKEPIPGLTIDKKLHGAGIIIVDCLGNLHGCIAKACA